jgi:hypothetical protein
MYARYGDFTPSEEMCISRKIEKLRGEGRSQDKAVAIAISMCAPSKAKNAAAAQAQIAAGPAIGPGSAGSYAGDPTVGAAPSTRPAGGPTTYRATQNPDGSWNVYDVPIFVEHVDTRRRPALPITKAWLANALKAFRARVGEGYLPPLHVYHHLHPTGEARDTIPAGHFRPKRLGQLIYEGRPRTALFADLVEIPPTVYADIRAGRLSYRSVEIHPPHFPEESAEIDSVALLPDEVPFFRLPLLRVSEAGTPSPGAYRCTNSPVRAWRALEGGAVAALLRFNSTPGKAIKSSKSKEARPMARFDDASKPPIPANLVKEDAAAAPMRKEDEDAAAMKEDAAAPMRKEDEDAARPLMKDDTDAGAGAASLDTVVKILGKIAQALGVDVDAVSEDEDQAAGGVPPGSGGLPAERGVPPAPPVAAAHAGQAAVFTAALEGQIRGLTSRLDGFERERKAEAHARKAKAELAGYVLGDPAAWQAEVDRKAAQGDAVLAAYVDGLKKAAKAAPHAAGAAAAVPMAAPEPGDPPAVVAYAAAGSTAMTEARRLLAERKTLRREDRIERYSDAQYLAIQPEMAPFAGALAK